MKRRFTVLVLFLFILTIFIFACSKDLSFDDDPIGIRDVKSLNPDPIPPDTLMLDTLDDPDYR